MRKAAGKRLPHGGSSNLVLAWLWHLHMETGETMPVSRARLIAETGLPDTTVDDRLRVLSRDGGPVLSVGRGLYAPRHHKGNASPNKHDREPESPGKRHPKVFWGEEVVLLEEWISIKEYFQRHGKIPEPGHEDENCEGILHELAEETRPKRHILVPQSTLVPSFVFDGEGNQYEVKPVFPFGRVRYLWPKT